jgi:hypothetical protein
VKNGRSLEPGSAFLKVSKYFQNFNLIYDSRIKCGSEHSWFLFFSRKPPSTCPNSIF